MGTLESTQLYLKGLPHSVAADVLAPPLIHTYAQIVTILTPFSISPMTDASVDALPTLFLAYCAMSHADSTIAD